MGSFMTTETTPGPGLWCARPDNEKPNQTVKVLDETNQKARAVDLYCNAKAVDKDRL